jgi:hypothetical protein
VQGLAKKLDELERAVKYTQKEGHVIHVFASWGEQAQGLAKKVDELQKAVKYAEKEGHVIHVCTGLGGSKRRGW